MKRFFVDLSILGVVVATVLVLGFFPAAEKAAQGLLGFILNPVFDFFHTHRDLITFFWIVASAVFIAPFIGKMRCCHDDD